MLRKTFQRASYLAISCILVFLLSVPCLATGDVSTRMTNIAHARCDLVLEDGNAYASASVTGYSGAEKCKIVLKIQEQKGTNWATVDICAVEENRSFAVVSSSITVKEGTTYRAQATVTVWINGTPETKTFASQ